NVSRAFQVQLIGTRYEVLEVLRACENGRGYLLTTGCQLQRLREGRQTTGIGGPAQRILVKRRQAPVIRATPPNLEVLRRACQDRLKLLHGPARTQESDEGIESRRIGTAVQELLVEHLYLIGARFQALFDRPRDLGTAHSLIEKGDPIGQASCIRLAR